MIGWFIADKAGEEANIQPLKTHCDGAVSSAAVLRLAFGLGLASHIWRKAADSGSSVGGVF